MLVSERVPGGYHDRTITLAYLGASVNFAYFFSGHISFPAGSPH